MRRWGALAGLALVIATAGAAAPGAASSASASPALTAQVTALIDGVRRKAAALPASDEGWKSLAPEVERLVALAESEVAGGRLYTALERLADANRYVGGASFSFAHPEMNTDLDRFTAGWSAADRDLKAGEAAWRAGSWKKSPAAVRGVAEIEYGQVRPLYMASRDYAVADSPASGTHYVGQA
ncbi:MAG TPA: hypothetical protein VMQ62_14145, partial [Dongiaceae bacterium]|nr:hypothetical protein [Dongiaceae bacterium]